MKKSTVKKIVIGTACVAGGYLCYQLGWACSENGFIIALSECCDNRTPGYVDYNGRRLLVTVAEIPIPKD